MGLLNKIGKIFASASKDSAKQSESVWVRGDAVTHFPPYTTAKVLRTFNATVGDELSVDNGTEVRAVYRENEWIYVEGKDGRRGFVPDEFCKIKIPRDMPVAAMTLERQKVSRRESNRIKKEFLKQSKEIDRRRVHKATRPLRRADTFHAGDKAEPSNLQRFLDSLPVLKQEGEPFVKAPQGMSRVRHSFEHRNSEEVTIAKGEEVVILNTSNPDWTYARNVSGEEGFIPTNHLYGMEGHKNGESTELDLFVVEPYSSDCGLDLTTIKGEWLKAYYPEVDGWLWAERPGGTKGFIPTASCIVASNI